MAEVLSAVIKCIRRGEPDAAGRWALELQSCGEPAEGFLWECLLTCAVEDVGLARPDAITIVDACMRAAGALPPGFSARGLHAVHAAAFLAQCQKTRWSEELHARILEETARGVPLPSIPDCALDHHTARGRALGRGLGFYYGCAALLENEKDDVVGRSTRDNGDWLRSTYLLAK